MAYLATACRLSVRLAARRAARDGATRGYRTSAATLTASNFTMPALSPTMTEGNIASWKVKEGDSFAAGDVLLEIETDKATMDVEAQDDGVIMKIMQTDGTKAVQVGTRIAVIAEPGDDISALEIPPDEKPATKEASKDAPAPASGPEKGEPRKETKGSSTGGTKKLAPKQTYPLLPSVKQLMMQKGVLESDIPKMTPSGPKGRLLKGDVLAYLGMVNTSRPKDIQTRFEKLSHLDLTNVKVTAPKEAPKKSAPTKKDKPAAPEPEPEPELKLDVALPISLAPVIEFQQRLEDKLGVNMPLSAFIARATELANNGLPLASNYKPTADELFDQILGFDTVSSKVTKGFYMPQITALPQAQMAASRLAAPKTNMDVIDILTSGASKPRKAVGTAGMVGVAMSTGTNYFTLTVPKAEEKRAKLFLERVKLVLEEEPGRLVL